MYHPPKPIDSWQSVSVVSNLGPSRCSRTTFFISPAWPDEKRCPWTSGEHTGLYKHYLWLSLWCAWGGANLHTLIYSSRCSCAAFTFLNCKMRLVKQNEASQSARWQLGESHIQNLPNGNSTSRKRWSTFRAKDSFFLPASQLTSVKMERFHFITWTHNHS